MIKQAFQIIRNMGIRYTLYRFRHDAEKRTGILKIRHPVNPPIKNFISLSEWRKNTLFFVIPEREKLFIQKQPNDKLKLQTERIIKGEICFFSWDWKQLGKNYDWITNPDTGFRYDINKHWSEIPDFSSQTGDIKYVWEKSRFTYLLTIIRNDYHNDEDHAEFVFSEIESWIDANPINQGPNWRCSQEISLRILNWCYALSFYKNSSSLTEQRWNKIQQVIYWSLHHVYHHIDFSRIAVRNNHAITETLFLALSNMLFPFIPETKKWSRKGRKWFEQEIDYQIYNDGTFLQFSMNYHRVVIQLLTLGISLTEKHHKPFSRKIYEKAYKSLNFLYQCTQEENGFLPNYGANDGAWFFPLSDTDYCDFRPQLNSLHEILTGICFYDSENIKEEAQWMGIEISLEASYYPILKKEKGILKFPTGGYYLIRDEDNTFTFIKCGKYKDRPSHADNLHIDIWYKGKNVVCDGGSFMYNTDEKLVKYFSGTESHNTVMLDNYDQMLKGPRFIWLNWTQALFVELKENDHEYIFTGEVKCYTYLNKNIIHKRTIRKIKNQSIWYIKDEMIQKPQKMTMRQLWHTPEENVVFYSEGNQCFVQQGWISLYYGQKEKTKQTEFLTQNNSIETKMSIK